MIHRSNKNRRALDLKFDVIENPLEGANTVE